MTYVLVGIACLAVGAGIAALFFRRELRRMAGFLRGREARSNARMTVEAPGRAFAELAEAVNAQLDAAQQERLDGQRRQQEFQRDLASLSHDIRTPLMGAKGYLRLAQDEGDEAGRDRRLAAAEARLDDMGALLDQLFAYAQANDPDLALDLVPVAVLPALADVLVGQFPAFERRGWEPRVDFEDEALSVDADAEALARIFENLVANALRHGSGPLAVGQRGACVTFANEVPDPAALDPERLFERFYRADDARSAAGSGLGLAVSAASPPPWECACPRAWRETCWSWSWGCRKGARFPAKPLPRRSRVAASWSAWRTRGCRSGRTAREAALRARRRRGRRRSMALVGVEAGQDVVGVLGAQLFGPGGVAFERYEPATGVLVVLRPGLHGGGEHLAAHLVALPLPFHFVVRRRAGHAQQVGVQPIVRGHGRAPSSVASVSCAARSRKRASAASISSRSPSISLG